MIINANVAAVYYQQGYRDELADQMLREAGIELINWRSPDGGER